MKNTEGFQKNAIDNAAEKSNKKKNKKTPQNRKRLNNKVLKAKKIIAKNHEVQKNQKNKHSDCPEIPRWKRMLIIIKRILFWLLIVFLAVLLLSFLLIRVRGGTPSIFGYCIQRVTSGSMEPTLLVGDIIVSKELSDPSDIEIDDIITFKGGSEFEYNDVTHRVVVPPMKNKHGDYVLTTKGDANERADGEIYYSEVKSKYVTKLEFLNRFFDFFLSPWGLIVFIASLLIIFFDELLTLVKILTGNYDEEDDEDLGEIMTRLKQEEEEKRRVEEKKREKRRRKPHKYDNTSNKKKKNRKKNSKKSRFQNVE